MIKNPSIRNLKIIQCELPKMMLSTKDKPNSSLRPLFLTPDDEDEP